MIKIKNSGGHFNWPLLSTILFLLAYGLIALYSASTVQSFQNHESTTYYIFHQMFYGALLGLIGLVIFSKIDYHFWQKQLPILLFGSLVLLLMVKLGNFGFGAGGAERWLHFGPISLQPSELAKLVIVFYIASWVDKKGHALNNFYFGLLPSLLIVGLFASLILWQPDLGTMLVLVSVAFGMLFLAGVELKKLFAIALAGLLLLFIFVKVEPYRAQRLTSFFNRHEDKQNASYQINQAILAVGSGQVWGYGYGLSRQKHSYLPEVMNDSIFAVTSEELGFARVIVIIVLFGLLAIQGFYVATRAPDIFGKLVAGGITLWITLQAIINIAAMVNLVPLTGIPLPFFSYGSTALLVNLSSLGILFSISRKSSL